MRPINESVLLAIHDEQGETINLGYLDNTIVTEAMNDRIKRLEKMLRSGHYGIVSPHRSFPHHDDSGHSMKPEGDAEIYKGDTSARNFVGADWRGGHGAMRSSHNFQAWSDIKKGVKHLGFRPLLAVGAWQESGSDQPGTEGSVILPGEGNSGVKLSVGTMTNLAKVYNQDGFIYAGPETGGEPHYFWASKRSPKTGLPLEYTPSDKPLGRAEKPSDVKALIARLKAPEGDPAKIMGITQPRQHGENPSAKDFGQKPGKGKGTVITTTPQNPTI